MAQGSIAGIEEFLQGLFQREQGLKELVAWLANQAMQNEVSEHVGAERHERTDGRMGYRNGSKPRQAADAAHACWRAGAKRSAEAWVPAVSPEFVCPLAALAAQ